MKPSTLADVSIGEKFGSPWGYAPNFHFGTLISNVLTAAISISGVIALLLFITGGLKIIMGASNSDSRSTGEGKQTVTWAVIGFIIIFTAYWIIRVIELISGVDFITNPISIFI